MLKNNLFFTTRLLFIILTFKSAVAQQATDFPKTKNNFWKNMQYGGSFGINISSGYTNLLLAPSAIYNCNASVAVGAGLNLNYRSASNFSSFVYGINTLVLINPIPEIQFSLDLNQSRVNYQDNNFDIYSENYWETSIILGAGYRAGNVTIGVGFDVLQNDRFDSDPFVPFIRAYF